MGTLSLSELDFSRIKEQLKEYLKDDPTFTDYNFEGAGLSYLLNILAANTTLKAYYLNMVANEMFLDSAILRGNVVSRAKAIGYTPRSAKSSKAVLNVTFTVSGSPATITIPKNTKFSATVSSRAYSFVVPEAIVINQSAFGTYSIEGLEVFEGTVLTHKYTVNTTDESQKFLLPNLLVDTDRTTVSVQNSDVDTGTLVYTRATNLTEITGEDPVYWLSETYDQTYEVFFGDDVLGKSVIDGNIVILQYLKTSAELADGASNFSLASSIPSVSSASVTTVSISTGGAQPESIDSIKFLAPLFYESQGRAVTKSDYEILIQREYPYVRSVRVWGGEDHEPPQYGKVFIALMPSDGYSISSTNKNRIINDIIKPKNIIPIQIEIVDPEYTYLEFDIRVTYSPALTSLTAGDIADLSKERVLEFFTNQLNRFESKFRFSKLTAYIDSGDVSIKNNEIDVIMKYKLVPTLSVPTQYTVQFNNKISSGDFLNKKFGIYIEGFIYNGYACFISDNGQGILQIYRFLAEERINVVENAGTVDYETGKVVINNFAPSSIVSGNNFISIKAVPEYDDLESLRNQIISVLEDDILVSTLTE